MSTLSIPTVAMASISFYVGLYHLLIYRRRRQHREDLTFGLLCLATGLYDVFCAGLYSATSVAEGVQWQRAQFIALALFATAFLWFVSDYTYQKPQIATYAFSAFYLLAILIQTVDRSSLTWIVNVPSVKEILLPNGLEITYYEATLGPFTTLQGLMGLVVSTYILWGGVRFYRRGYKREAVPLLLALGCQYAAAFNDTAVSNGLYHFIYTIEYAYLAMLLLMAYSLSNTVVEAAKAKEALRESEAIYYSLVETLPMSVCRKDLAGRFTFGNRQFCDGLKKSLAGIVGKTDFDLHPNELALKYRRDDQWVIETGQVLEAVEEHGDLEGDRSYVQVWKSPLRDADGKIAGVQIMFWDITERKRAEEALRVSEEKFSKAFRSSPDVISISSLRDGRFVEINEGFRNLLGYRRDEVIGRTALELNTWRRPEDRREALAALETQRQIRGVEVEYRTKSGRLITCLLSAEVIELNGEPCLLAVSRDITERKQAEEALKQYAEQAQQRAEQLATMNEIGRAVSTLQDLDSVMEIIYHQVRRIAPVDTFYICLYDPEHEQIVFPLVYDMGGHYTEPTIPLKPDSQIAGVIRTGKPFMLHRTMEELQTLHGPSLGIGNRQRKSASVLIVPLWRGERVMGVLSVQSYTMNAYTEEHAEILTGIGHQASIAIENAQLYEQAQQEIVERRRVQAERERLIAELEAKNAELERFTYTVSHDLKSPLVTIRGFLGFLEKDAASGDVGRMKADMGRITGATDKMQRLLTELLELSRVGRTMNPPKAVPFETVVREALELAHGRLEARGVQVAIAPDLPTVQGDRARLVEVVQNLVDNACKFMGDQPEPRIEIGQRGARADAEGKPILFVRDNGIGIDPQYQERIFGLFNKLDAQTEGTGVGLALVKRIVEVHGGRIWVESAGLAKGSTFCFTLPILSAQTESS